MNPFTLVRLLSRPPEPARRRAFHATATAHGGGRLSKSKDEQDHVRKSATVAIDPKATTASFKQLGLRPALCDALARAGISRATPLQAAMIPLVLTTRRDLLVRDVTGSGKTLGATLALLSLTQTPERQPFPDPDPPTEASGEIPTARGKFRFVSPRHVLVVPHGDLALQVAAWVRALLSEDQFPDLSCVLQTAFVPPPPINLSGFDGAARRVLIQQRAAQSPTYGAYATPHLLIGTPRRLLEEFQAGTLDVRRIDTIAIDEIDSLTPPISKYNPKARLNRQRHPKPIETFLDDITRERTPPEARDLPKDADPRGSKLARARAKAKPRVIALSATASAAVRDHLRFRGWLDVTKLRVLDTTGTVRASARLEHVALCVAPGKAAVTNVLVEAKAQAAERARRAVLQSGPGARREFDRDEDDADADDRRVPTPSINDLTSAVVAYCRHHNVRRALVFPCVSGMGVSAVADALNGYYQVRAAYLTKEYLLGLERTLTGEDADDGKTLRATVVSADGARGLDFAHESHVFVLGAPADANTYLHVAGRVGRLGRGVGTVVSLIAPAHATKMATILRSITTGASSKDKNDGQEEVAAGANVINLDEAELAIIRGGGSV
ncbi:hypothetical protein AMAG_02853 [Allomyces macrogynus ATCC 38327]|uniref:P-loop containing nucleoside triphosphate hydrolase protein n=1 Tax=Allomyces macrogynus (strain ATCC 38327) TaxID=578462 RepID=A0A0L0S3I1_ALLM3|nr:hypothetical protein AMAG_02853 [Allomyces macrogynus ATCC 38327]|eukprot:KNE57103.1 hypothetical protein AMAG_02853 [Allomyces macrogynus ATCC 38327]